MQIHSSTVRVPLLGAGRHIDPEHGVGLLELVSILSHSVWTDRPAGVHPLLAVVADAVNDSVSARNVRVLAPLAPWLAATDSTRPATASAIAFTCVNAALPHADDRAAAGLLRTIESTRAVLIGSPAKVRRGPWVTEREQLRAGDQVRAAVRILAESHRPGAYRDRLLVELLESCLNAVRATRGAAAVHPRLAVDRCPDHIDLLVGRGYHPLTGEAITTYRPADPSWEHRLVVASWSAGRI